MSEMHLILKIVTKIILVITGIKCLKVAAFFEENKDEYRSIKWLLITLLIENIALN